MNALHISQAPLVLYRKVQFRTMVHRAKDIKKGVCLSSLSAESALISTSMEPYVLSFGEMLIDFVPNTSGVSLAEAESFKKAPGGAPANVSVGISRLGGKSAFLGKTGDDEFGHMLADILAENGVDIRGVLFDKNAKTALAFVTLKSDGEREFMFYRNPSADMLLRPNELNQNLIREADIVHFGSISLISEPCKSAHLELLKIAKDSNCLISYDPNVRLPLWPSPESARKEILSIWDKADIIKVSDEEVDFLLPESTLGTEEAAKSLFHDNLKLLLITEGKNGSRYYTPFFSGKVEGFKVEPVDTTGAGDAFLSGFLSKLLENKEILKDEGKLREAVRFSNACGAICTLGRGAIPSLPTPQEVDQFLLK